MGVAVSAFLLSLGAPFWFHILQDLVRPRSAATSQEKLDRKLRDGTQPASINSSAPSPPELPDHQS